MTPNFAVIGIETPQWHGLRLWFPLFLLWIPAILLAPLVLLILLVIWSFGPMIVGIPLAYRVNPWRAIAILWSILCALPGTHVRVSTHDAKVLVRIL